MDTSTLTLPPKLRLTAYLVLAALNVVLLAWDPSFGHVAVVQYGVKVIAGLTALVLGIASSHVTKADPGTTTTPAPLAPTKVGTDTSAQMAAEFLAEQPASAPAPLSRSNVPPADPAPTATA